MKSKRVVTTHRKGGRGSSGEEDSRSFRDTSHVLFLVLGTSYIIVIILRMFIKMDT